MIVRGEREVENGTVCDIRTTRNLLIIWPFFHAVGVLLDFAVNIDGVEQVVGDFPWAVGTVIVMAIVAGVLALSRVRNQVLSE